MSKETKYFYDFGNFRLDPSEKVLLRDGEFIPITPKVFETLRLLVENAGHLVEKGELMRKIWQEQFVEESNLSFNIKMLRKALGDNAQNPRFVKTVPTRGYRFIAEVQRVEAEVSQFGIEDEAHSLQLNNKQTPLEIFPPPAKRSAVPRPGGIVTLANSRQQEKGDNAQEEVPPSTFSEESNEQTHELDSPDTKPNAKSEQVSNYRRLPAAIALAVLLIGAVALGYYFFGKKGDSTVADGKKSIAVLPIKPINTDDRDEIYEIGIADSLIYRLSSMKGFVVRPLSATRQYTNVAQDPLEAGREQKVDYVLAANYQFAGGKIRVTAQLFNVASGQVEETYKSEKNAGDVFAMQDAIADEVGNLLLSRFTTTASTNPTARRGTDNEEAYRLYHQGMYLSNNRNPTDAREAIEVLEKAVRLDPNYAQAWAGKAYAHRTLGNMGRLDTHEPYQKSIEAINKALALDVNLSDAYSILCENKMYYEYDFAGAERECRRAIELSPDSALAHQIYSRYLAGRGRFDEAITEIKTAIDLEPTSRFNQRFYGDCLHFARRYPEAVAQYKRLIAMDKNFETTYMWLSNTLALQGNESEAFEYWMKILVLRKADAETLQIFQTAFQTSGWRGILEERVKRFEEEGEAFFQGAAHHAQVGNKDQAFEYLEKSFQRRELWMGYLRVDPRFDSLNDDPRFDELVRRVGLK